MTLEQLTTEVERLTARVAILERLAQGRPEDVALVLAIRGTFGGSIFTARELRTAAAQDPSLQLAIEKVMGAKSHSPKSLGWRLKGLCGQEFLGFHVVRMGDDAKVGGLWAVRKVRVSTARNSRNPASASTVNGGSETLAA